MGSFWDKLNKAADDFTNQFNNTMGTGTSYQNGSYNAYSNQGNYGQYAQNNQSGSFLDSLISGVNGASQNANFSNYIMNAVQGRDLNSMSESERNNLLKNAMEHCGADKTPNTTLGRVYPLVKKRVEERERNIALPTAHSTCPAQCGESRDSCEKCLKRRLAVLEALYYIDQPEEYKKRFSGNSQNQLKQSDMKCSLCGAPVKPSMKVCEYCDTPVSCASDNRSSYLSLTEYVPPEQAAYDLIYEVTAEAADKMNEPEAREIMTAVLTASFSQAGVSEAEIRRLLDSNYQSMLSLTKAKMTIADINYMANEYHMSVSTYLRGLFEGDVNLQIAAVYRNNKRIEAERKQNQEEHERKMKAIRESYERQKKANDEFWQRRRDSYRPPQYNGGSGGGSGDYHNCAHCVNYANGFCGYKQWKTNASDSCGYFKLR